MTSPTPPSTADVHTYLPGGHPIPPPANTVVARLVHWARVQPDRPYLKWCPSHGPSQVLTYGELERRSREPAISPADAHRSPEILALLPGNDIPSVVAVFSALRSGVPCLFLNPHDPLPRLREILAAHPVRRCWRSPFVAEHAADLAETLAPVGTVPASGTGPESAPSGEEVRLAAERTAMLFGTSGSTASSKLVAQPHRALVSNADAMCRHHRLDCDTILMGGLPLHHVNGVHFSLIATLFAGAHLVLPQEISPFTYRDLMEHHEPHIASLVPPVLEMLLATGRGWRPPRNLRYFLSAAAPLTTDLVRRVVNAFGVRVVQGYGLSETTNFSTTVPVDAPEAVYRAVALDAAIPSVGVPVQGNEVEVFGADDTLLGEGQMGEIRMRGHNVMEGYANRLDLTAEAFAGGWFHSGDVGYWATGPDGLRYFYLTGRTKNIAKVRGVNVSLEEVERVLLSIEGVRDAGCVAVPHETSGEELAALVVTTASGVDGIRSELAELLPETALPSRWLRLDSIPRTTTGKLQRPQLAALVRQESPA